MSADKILFRCSSLGHIMTKGNEITKKQLEKIEMLSSKPKLTDIQKNDLADLIYKKNNPSLGDTCIKHLIDVFVSQHYKRREETTSKFLTKGNEREEDSITLVSRCLKTVFNKNTTRLYNEYIQGEPDLFLGESIISAEVTIDTKTSWSAHTFFRSKSDDVKSIYYWQGQGYMWLTGAKKHLVVYCLVNGTDKAIQDEKKRAAYQLGVIDHSSEKYEQWIDKCKQIEINHIFDMESFKEEYPFFQFDNDISSWKYDIPIRERLFAFEIERNDAEIEKIRKRVIECRKYMNDNFYKKEIKNFALNVN